MENTSSTGIRNGAVDGPLGLGDVGVERLGQLQDAAFAELALVALEGELGRAVHDRGGVAGELVLVEQLAHFHLDELEQLGVVDHVALVHVDDDVRHAHLARQQDVLARLRHRAVGRAHHQDRAVHLRRTGDHVLDVVGVPGAVDVRVVPVLGLVLDVGGVDRDAARLLLGRRVDLVVRLGLAAEQLAQHRRDRRRQRRLAVVHVTNGPHVHVRLGPLEFALCHFRTPIKERWPVCCLRFPAPALAACHGQHAKKRRRPSDKGSQREPAVLWGYFPRAVMIASATFFGASL